jgi:uncharacterized membrane protein HdeD (DUF308 family)
MIDAAVTPAQSRSSGAPALWWASPLLGVLSIAAGVVILARPHNSLATLAVVAGVFMLFDSVYEVAMSLRRDTEARGFSAIIGVLGIVAGILLIRHPVVTVTAIALILGIWLTAIGAVRLVSAVVGDRRVPDVVLGLVQIVAGIVIVGSPDIGIATLAVLAGISFLLNGVVLIGSGWLARTADG